MSDEVKAAETVDQVAQATVPEEGIHTEEGTPTEISKDGDTDSSNPSRVLAARYKSLALKFKAAYEGLQAKSAERIAQLELACKNVAEKGVLASLLADDGSSAVSIACRVSVPLFDGTFSRWCLLSMVQEDSEVPGGDKSEKNVYITEWVAEDILLERFPGFKEAVNACEMFAPPSSLHSLKGRVTEAEEQNRRIQNRTERQLQQKDEEIRYLTDLVSKFSGLDYEELPPSDGTLGDKVTGDDTDSSRTSTATTKGPFSTPQSKLQARVQSAAEFISSMSSGKVPLIGNTLGALGSGGKFSGDVQQEVAIIKRQEKKIADLAEKRRVMMQTMMNYQTETEELRSEVAKLQAEIEVLKQENKASPLVNTKSGTDSNQSGNRMDTAGSSSSSSSSGGKGAHGQGPDECSNCKKVEALNAELSTQLSTQVTEAVQSLKDEYERRYHELDGEYSAYRRRMVALVKEKEAEAKELAATKETLALQLKEAEKKKEKKQEKNTDYASPTTASQPSYATNRSNSSHSRLHTASTPGTPIPEDPALEYSYLRALLLRYLRETDVSVRHSLEMALAGVLRPNIAEHMAIEEARSVLYPGVGVGDTVGDALGKVTSGVVTGVSSLLSGWMTGATASDTGTGTGGMPPDTGR